MAVLRVIRRRVGGIEHAFLAAHATGLAAVLFRDACDVIGEKDDVGPFLEQRHHRFAQLQFKPVVAAGLIRGLEFLYRRVGEEYHVHAAGEQGIE